MSVAAHGVQFGPAKFTSTVAGSKLDPLMANENGWPATGGLGLVVIPEIAIELLWVADTLNAKPADGVPAAPFCTLNV